MMSCFSSECLPSLPSREGPLISDAKASQASSLTGFLVPDTESADQVIDAWACSGSMGQAPGRKGLGVLDTGGLGGGCGFPGEV